MKFFKKSIIPFAILLAVVIVVMVNSVNNYNQERAFRAQDASKKKPQCSVIRAGKTETIVAVRGVSMPRIPLAEARAPLLIALDAGTSSIRALAYDGVTGKKLRDEMADQRLDAHEADGATLARGQAQETIDRLQEMFAE